jgi:hypothetical protein
MLYGENSSTYTSFGDILIHPVAAETIDHIYGLEFRTDVVNYILFS